MSFQDFDLLILDPPVLSLSSQQWKDVLLLEPEDEMEAFRLAAYRHLILRLKGRLGRAIGLRAALSSKSGQDIPTLIMNINY